MALDIIAAFTNEPPELDFIWSGFLLGTVGALVAPGATGKSFWALEAAMAVACSVAGGDVIGLSPVHTGRVLYIAGEDPEPALVQRIHAIGQYIGQSARESIAAHLVLEPIVGKRLNILNKKHFDRVIEIGQDAKLIVFDTLSRIHELDENSNRDMARLVSVFERLAMVTGAAVLYLHHVSKGSAREGQTDQQAARGASALIDNARWCGFLSTMTESEGKQFGFSDDIRKKWVRFGVSKQNYCPSDADRWLKRDAEGVLVVDTPKPNVKNLANSQTTKGDDDAWR